MQQHVMLFPQPEIAKVLTTLLRQLLAIMVIPIDAGLVLMATIILQFQVKLLPPQTFHMIHALNVGPIAQHASLLTFQTALHALLEDLEALDINLPPMLAVLNALLQTAPLARLQLQPAHNVFQAIG